MPTILSPVMATNWRLAFKTDREKTLAQIYARAYPMVLHYVKQHNGQPEDAQDLLQEAIIVFYEKVMQEEFRLTASVTTYLMAICKNHWRQELEKQQRRKKITLEEINPPDEVNPAETKAAGTDLIYFVEQLGDKCRNILISFYYFGQSLTAIAEKNRYRSVRSATVQKFKCLERLRKSLSGLSGDYFR
ncbi:RNA polymerase sigma factor [Adhaeribacter pallidiroseus]|uniref:RNA polymerase sigma-70 region 2 domain-containing protein n=1 Tax=Adhaeribacter pallidiroseus TaxID=2072847 RepID=A0A369QPS7_9BACT|nr:sigma-70 family RNA polymerase sigma factor [Adhaeribacter pallidiroseus]RDC64218.1 hypothetical protein AHMF7616_02830 [Adhaeribacter pallidiroseus]